MGRIRRSIHERGDTIVEVLLAMAVVGMVLGVAYGIANRSVIIGRSAQERSEALKIAESQLERLHELSIADANGLLVGDSESAEAFCVDESGALQSFSINDDELEDDTLYPDECKYGTDNRYLLSVVKSDDYLFSVRTRWQALGSNDFSELDMFYTIFPKGSQASAVVPSPPTPPTPPSPSFTLDSISFPTVRQASATVVVTTSLPADTYAITISASGLTSVRLENATGVFNVSGLIPDTDFAIAAEAVRSGDNVSGGDSFRTIGPSGYSPLTTYNGSVYYLASSSTTWVVAAANARSNDTYLATVSSIQENNELSSRLGPIYAWIGLNDAANEGTFVWHSGETSTYRNFYSPQPDNWAFGGPGGEDYVHINNDPGYGGRWNDLGASSSAIGIIEYRYGPQI